MLIQRSGHRHNSLRRLRLLPYLEELSSHAMTKPVLLSSFRNGGFVLRASCNQQGACRFSWEIDIDDAMRTLGDVTLGDLRKKLHCPKCNAAITTTLISLK